MILGVFGISCAGAPSEVLLVLLKQLPATMWGGAFVFDHLLFIQYPIFLQEAVDPEYSRL